jgi:hypothetical protein
LGRSSALRAHPSFRAQIDRSALLQYFPRLRSRSRGIYVGIAKLSPGTVLSVRSDSPRSDPAPVAYWSATDVAEAGVADPFRGGPGEAIEAMEALLQDAVKIRMVADVPVGAFLSGGIDSSTIVALMQAQGGMPVRTFTIAFDDPRYNEAEHAAAVARHLGTEHHEFTVSSAEAQAVIAQLPRLYDEPFADTSQIPTYLVAKLTRQHVTVSLSGDADVNCSADTAGIDWGRRSGAASAGSPCGSVWPRRPPSCPGPRHRGRCPPPSTGSCVDRDARLANDSSRQRNSPATSPVAVYDYLMSYWKPGGTDARWTRAVSVLTDRTTEPRRQARAHLMLQDSRRTYRATFCEADRAPWG